MRLLGLQNILNLFLILGTLWITNQSYGKSPLIFVYSEQYPPCSWVDQETDKGFYIDLIKEIFEKRLQQKVVFKGLPWKRAQEEVAQGKADAFITSQTPARQEYATSGKEPILKMKNSLYTSVRNPHILRFEKAKALNDLKKFKFVGTRGNAWQQEQLKDTNFSVVDNRANVLPVLMLMRVDLWVETDVIADYIITNKKLEKDIIKLKNSLDFKDITAYIHIGKKSQYIPLLSDIDNSVQAIKNDGTYKKLLQKYHLQP